MRLSLSRVGVKRQGSVHIVDARQDARCVYRCRLECLLIRRWHLCRLVRGVGGAAHLPHVERRYSVSSERELNAAARGQCARIPEGDVDLVVQPELGYGQEGVGYRWSVPHIPHDQLVDDAV